MSTAPDPRPRTIPCHEPATGRALGEVAVDGPDAVRAAIAASRQAQAAWGASPFAVRRRVLTHVLRHVLDHADELCEVIARDSGKTLLHAMMGEIWPVAEKLRWTIRHGERHLRPERVSSGMMVHKRATITYEPLGVIGVICPWNYPLQNVMGPTIAALMAGNGVVIKASEWVAWSTARFQRIFDEALAAEGFDPALVRIVNGYGPTGAAVVEGGVDGVVFTGSRDNGRRVVQSSAVNLIPVILELGGKDPLIVCDDAHLEQAVHAAMNGVFINAGQNCLSSERILVFDGVYDAFVARVTALTSALSQGDPLGGVHVDVGAIVSPLQLDRIEALVDDAVAKGARAVVGGGRVMADTGQFFAPTVLVDVTLDMDILQEETFGPVMVVLRVRDEAEALAVANGTGFGLSSTVFTTDPVRARRMERGLVAGSTIVNDFGLSYMAQSLPFGGAKESGFGRLNGRDGLRACCNVKAVLDDRLPIHRPNALFPSGPGDLELARQAIRTLYSPDVSDKVAGAAGLARAWWTRR
ncbi:MAG: aldehyde dehydrogenase family protein [Alphaproteobacteria bacterium]|nr:aldehyde dehydrogenase family protein [Alphaproteobacteria bacterium]